jgi:hypothetical protein
MVPPLYGGDRMIEQVAQRNVIGYPTMHADRRHKLLSKAAPSSPAINPQPARFARRLSSIADRSCATRRALHCSLSPGQNEEFQWLLDLYV